LTRTADARRLDRGLLLAATIALTAGLLAAAARNLLSIPVLVMLLITVGAFYCGASLLGRTPRSRSGPAGLASLAGRAAGEPSADAQDSRRASDHAEIDRIAQRLLALEQDASTHQRKLDYVANHDPLTGLGNRRYLGERLAQALNHLRLHPDIPISLLLLDLDGFKLINDGLGHAAGDAALCEVAKRLRALMRPDDALARLGSDEFAVVLFDQRAGNADAFFASVSQALAQPLNLDRRTVKLGVSAGIAEGVTGMTAHDWQRHADLALVAGKREGRNRLCVFRDSLRAEAARALRLEQALRLAIANDDLDVWFQPVVDGRDGHVLGMEALCRWTFDGEAIAPLEFIPLAESTGQIADLGRAVLRRSCQTLAGLRARHPGLRCSINLSVGQFADGRVEADLLQAVSDAGLPLSMLRLEITESLVANDASGVLPAMHRLVEAGAEFCLDDFGTGFSALGRLRQLPIRALKIDRSFVTPLRDGDEVLVRSIAGLCRDLDLDCVAEGVEQEEERRRLCDIGCHAMQGFLLAKPMPARELSAWLEHRVLRSTG